MPHTLYDKIFAAHTVSAETAATPAVLYIDLHLIHEVTSPQAFSVLREHGLPVRRPERTLATMDHSTPTSKPDATGKRTYVDQAAELQVSELQTNAKAFGVELHDYDSEQRGIVHVMGPELGATQPGMTIVCGDSHTATHGAFGALAFGIGTSEVGHVLATQCLLQRKAKNLAVTVNGTLRPGVSAKDLILHIIGALGVAGGTGYVIEYRGSAIRALDMEARMTLCNMSIEAGARAGLVAPDQVTFDYLRGRAKAPADFAAAVAGWQQWFSDADAVYDHELVLDANTIGTTITYGTNPAEVVATNGVVPAFANPKALAYMGLTAGQKLSDVKVDVVFVGSCTNGRLSDLKAVAEVLHGRKIAGHVRMLVVPGSGVVKREAEALGIDQIVLAAGAEWREPGCSMCIAMNGDLVAPGQVAVSTSNRNFEGRQGKQARTILASPRTAAASAVRGYVTDAESLAA
jgi:3-isopropylmalate/(R)-2-methylmalate dehydratase large subunit